LTSEPDDDRDSYRVVVNHEEQYSIWPSERENAPGWSDVGITGSKEQCLTYIDQVWRDITPRSVRDAIGSAHE
jgi:MbtH protein